jgi:hypothetical protein
MADYEKEREELRQKSELLLAYKRLSTNLDFKKLILKGFCEKEVLNLVAQASRETSTEGRQHLNNQAQAGSILQSYLLRVQLEGETAGNEMTALDALIAEEGHE